MTSGTVDRVALARAVAAGVTRVRGVARLSGGAGVEAATYHPGGKVLGVRVGQDTVTVHIVADQLPLTDLIKQVRRATMTVLAAYTDGRAVDVVVEDLDITSLPARSQPATADIHSGPAERPVEEVRGL